ncbi:MAG: Nif3-like dinuclear metal center hexameric protein [Bacteroidales bacterium]|jgi:putative NIF3 family GTP cyclohydrolase 1 type 2|nr:Nif3-like dinuclear metal center hexameric protein [Bacteroidales bacterium]
MIRKNFIRLTALSGMYFASGNYAKNPLVTARRNSGLSASQLQEFLTSMVELKPDTVDRIIIGNPDTIIKKLGTCWMPTWEACRKAVNSGVNVLVTHEPTFYTHRDLDEVPGFLDRKPDRTKEQYLNQIEKKKKWIIDNGLVIIRNHDTLDALGKRGIPFALGQFLGFRDSDIIASRVYYNVYKFEKQPASSFARTIAARLKELGQPGIAFYGDPAREVSSVGVGTGWICDPMDYADLEPDVFIAIDDIIRTHIQTVYAEDTGHPLIVINHGTSEEAGVRSLNRIIRENYPDIDVLHFSQGCTYDWITA